MVCDEFGARPATAVLDSCALNTHIVCMRRTNVVLDENLLEEAHRRSGEKTYSATINRALKELVRHLTLEEALKAISGTGWWEGDLAEMRRGREFNFPDEIRDAPLPEKPKRRRPRRGSR